MAEVCRQMGISKATFYIWEDIRQRARSCASCKAGKRRTQGFVRLVADLTLDRQILQEGFQKRLASVALSSERMQGCRLAQLRPFVWFRRTNWAAATAFPGQ
jgi:putative transposase